MTKRKKKPQYKTILGKGYNDLLENVKAFLEANEGWERVGLGVPVGGKEWQQVVGKVEK